MNQLLFAISALFIIACSCEEDINKKLTSMVLKTAPMAVVATAH